jgi:hypothetical protein
MEGASMKNSSCTGTTLARMAPVHHVCDLVLARCGSERVFQPESLCKLGGPL